MTNPELAELSATQPSESKYVVVVDANEYMARSQELARLRELEAAVLDPNRREDRANQDVWSMAAHAAFDSYLKALAACRKVKS